MPSPRLLPTALGLVLAAPLLLLTPAATAAPVGAVAAPYDFDGDGYPELVVGAPGLQVGSVTRAGGFSVLPASRDGLSTEGRTFTQATTGVAGDPEPDRGFGSAFASADFDHDGFADLVVGAPYGVEGSAVRPGTVTLLFGSAAGLTGVGSSVVARAGTADDDGFGTALVAADFDGDGFADLAAGAPHVEGVDVPDEDFLAGGSVTVLRGGVAGFSVARSTVLTGRTTGQDYDMSFGTSLAVGDVDGDPRPDLVVASYGLPYEDGDGHDGAVTVCPAAAACQQVSSAYPGLESLAVGNVSGSSRPEIVVGVAPVGNEEADTHDDAGSVFTLTLAGTGAGITAKVKELTQGTKGVPGSNEKGDDFGSSLALGDLDRDGYADLVVGAPGEAIGKAGDAGRVTVVHGGKKGYRTSGNQAYDQGTKGVPGAVETADFFGSAVLLLDHDADGHLDLTVGAAGENGDGGAITTLDGSRTGFTTKGAETFGLGSLGYPTRDRARFGAVLGG